MAKQLGDGERLVEGTAPLPVPLGSSLSFMPPSTFMKQILISSRT